MYRAIDKDVKIFVLKIIAIGLITFMSFILGLFSSILFWLITMTGVGLIAWEYISFTKEGN